MRALSHPQRRPRRGQPPLGRRSRRLRRRRRRRHPRARGARAHAIRRGAPILAEIVGYGMSADAHHPSAPPDDGDGVARVMAAALEDAALAPDDDRLSQRARDLDAARRRAEAIAIKRVFGDHARDARRQLDQVDDRPPARRRRRARSRPDACSRFATRSRRRRSTSSGRTRSIALNLVPNAVRPRDDRATP